MAHLKAPRLMLSAGTLLALSAIAPACTSSDDDGFGKFNGNNSTDDSAVVEDDTGPGPDDSDSSTDDSVGTDSGGSGGGELDEDGDVLTFAAGESPIDISDVSGDSNRDQEFFLIGINSGDSETGFRLRYEVLTSGAEGPPPPQSSQPQVQAQRPLGPLASPPPSPPIDASDIGSATEEFNVRDDFTDDLSVTPVNATLWAVGESVAIWVDNEVPIDWDFDCNGVVDQAATYDAYGFNNCDLQTVADIVDANIIVNLRAVLGEESDINGDGKVSVVISPILNNVPLTSDDEDDWAQVGSYSDPASDLTDFNYLSNPSSDEEEVIYVFAPDPYGFYNPFQTTTVDEYTSMGLAAEIARSYTRLVLYNQKVVLAESAEDAVVEESWLVEVLGTAAADLCGFGAAYYLQAWQYMDAPYLAGLTGLEEDASIFSGSSRGAQYLFGRWMLDNYGQDALGGVAQSSSVGTEAVIEAAGVESFDDLVVQWQVAMLATGVTNSSGDPLVDTTEWPQFAAGSTISAPVTPPDPPQVGVYYGANGHQTGFNIRGANRWYEGGTTSAPSEIVINRVVANGLDFHTYVPGQEFFGYGAGGYGAQVVRLTGLEYDAAQLDLQTPSEDGVMGVVVRWDPSLLGELAVDDIYSPLDVNAVALPPLPTGGLEISAIGDISDAATLRVIDDEGETATVLVDDTDRWLLDLSDRGASDIVQVAIWLDRQFENVSGDSAPEDPWLAITRASDLPTPSVQDTNSSSCPQGDTWAYPNLVPDYLADQIFLFATATATSDDSFDPCGAWGAALACEEDWDSDGVANADEPVPESFLQQVLIEQCSDNHGTVPSNPFTTSSIDADEIDEDDNPGFSVIYNIGGRSGQTGEEALLTTALQGGREYVVVVGGNGSTGTYELSFKQLN